MLRAEPVPPLCVLLGPQKAGVALEQVQGSLGHRRLTLHHDCYFLPPTPHPTCVSHLDLQEASSPLQRTLQATPPPPPAPPHVAPAGSSPPSDSDLHLLPAPSPSVTATAPVRLIAVSAFALVLSAQHQTSCGQPPTVHRSEPGAVGPMGVGAGAPASSLY